MFANVAIGQSINVLMPHQYRSSYNENLSSYLGADRTKIIGIGRELMGQRASGEIFPMDLAVTEMSLHNEKSFVGVVRDITERKRAEQALKQLNEELDQRVRQRTAELETVNARLETEIAERKKIEEKLQQRGSTLANIASN